ADPGLVDDDDLRAMEEAAREREPLAHSVGEGLDEPMRLLLEREDPEELAPERAHLLGRHAIETADEVEILPTGELPVEEGVVGDVADPRFRLDGLLRDVETVDEDAARGRQEEPGHDLHRRRLPGAVRAEECIEDPWTDLEVEAVHGELVAVELGEVFDANHGSSPLSASFLSSACSSTSPSLGISWRTMSPPRVTSARTVECLHRMSTTCTSTGPPPTSIVRSSITSTVAVWLLGPKTDNGSRTFTSYFCPTSRFPSVTAGASPSDGTRSVAGTSKRTRTSSPRRRATSRRSLAPSFGRP